MTVGGDFAQSLDKSLQAATALWERVDQSDEFKALMRPELDIVVFAVNGPDAISISERASEIFNIAASKNLHLALIELPVEMVRNYWPELVANRDTVRILRSCLMKPEHFEWVDDIWRVLQDAAGQ